MYMLMESYTTNHPAATTVTYTFDKTGKHTIKITSELNGFETDGIQLKLKLKRKQQLK